MRKSIGLAVAVILCSAALLRAEPVNFSQVSADAKWVAHLDLDAVRASTVLPKVREKILEKHKEAAEHLEKFKEIWKFNPCTDLHGVTLYGRQIKKDTGVAIVHAKVDQQALLEKAKAAPDHRTSTYGKYELHTWIHAKGTKHERTMTGVFFKPDTIIFGGSTAEVMAALDVLDGKQPNVVGKSSVLAAAVPPGAIVVARAVGLADADLPCKSPLAKQAESFSMAVGENKGESFVAATLAVKDAAVAKQMKAVVEGGIAVASLVHGNDADAMKLIGAAKVSVSDKTVSLEWRVPAEAVLAHAQKMCAKMAEKGWPHHGPWQHEQKKK